MRTYEFLLGSRLVASCNTPEALAAAKHLLSPHPFDYSARIRQLEEENRELNRRLVAAEHAERTYVNHSPTWRRRFTCCEGDD